ncbi:resistance to Congo red protein [Terriglobus aquaticus]|uniref:Resistance to Congo red protein n=1 Tax=Terriglobus aquaticus TaxID=940139 RepID=A0ABW9KNC0_9BACT|nr:resistance to Congo red protein [Terriglobus aquaticus]
MYILSVNRLAYTIWLLIAVLAAVGVGLTGVVNSDQLTVVILLFLCVALAFIAMDFRRRLRAGERPVRRTRWNRYLSVGMLVLLQISLYVSAWMFRHGPYGPAAVGVLVNLIWSWSLVKRLRHTTPHNTTKFP